MAAAHLHLMFLVQLLIACLPVGKANSALIRRCISKGELRIASETLSLVQLRVQGTRGGMNLLHQQDNSSTSMIMVLQGNSTKVQSPVSHTLGSLNKEDPTFKLAFRNSTRDAIGAGTVSVLAKDRGTSSSETSSHESHNSKESTIPAKKGPLLKHKTLWLTSLMPQWGPNWVNEAALLNVVFLNLVFAICFLCSQGHVADLAGVKRG